MSRMLLTIEQTGSPIRTHRRKQLTSTLRGLRLGRIGRTSKMPSTLETQGMLLKVQHLVRVIYVDIDYGSLAEEVRTEYRDTIIGPNSRITRGKVLWDAFEAALKRCLADPDTDDRELTERINEIAVAAELANDKALKGAFEYERALPGGGRIDFIADRGSDNLYVEVKTVRPQAEDTDEAWAKFLHLKKFHPATLDYVVRREEMGAKIHGNEYASRTHFLDYDLAFEQRLATAKAEKPGVGVLVFCGNGFAWRLTNLEDFADFYHTQVHRPDDPFGPMEKHHIKTKGIQLIRNIDHFAFLRRPIEEARKQNFTFPVRGRHFGFPPK